MSRDVVALFNHLGLEWADVVGYSMGAVIALRFTLSDPRVRRLVLGGNSGRAITQPDTPRSAERRRRIARALLAENPSTVDGSDGRDLRRFADDTRADRVALAAVQLAPNRYGTSSDLSMLRVPTLVICGDRDVSPDILASALPNAHAKVVPGTHISAISSADFAEAVRDFLA
jgi:pimeloyl-ACP methyl ester carboxylesterase